MEYNHEMTDKEFLQWCKEREIRLPVASPNEFLMARAVAKAAYEDGEDNANWIASGRPWEEIMKYKVVILGDSKTEILNMLKERGFDIIEKYEDAMEDADIILLGADMEAKEVFEFDSSQHYETSGLYCELTRGDFVEKLLDMKIPMKYNRPPVLSKIDWSNVKSQVENYIQQVEDADGDEVDSDLEHYIFEACLEAVYGKSIWDHVNSIMC